jgi:hypothetical protein
MRALLVALVLLALVAVTVGVVLVASPESPPSASWVRPADADDVLFGVHHDQDTDTVHDVHGRLGVVPAVSGVFVRFPFDEVADDVLEDNAAAALDEGAALMVTLEPHDGLDAVGEDDLEELTAWLTGWNERGLPVIVRFAHEMNGSWYPWGQRPVAFVETFRAVAAAVHEAPTSETMWAPNEGTGYPFADREDQAIAPEDLDVLDTDGDGELTQRDDPYAPYWPGAEHVDRVGLSIYHFGEVPPWGDNVAPEPGRFLDRVLGRYDGVQGDATSVPDFHAVYAEGEGLPLAIAETSALFVPEQAGEGPPEAEIKADWAAQLFADEVHRELPALDLVVWFDLVKQEEAVPDVTASWAFTHDDEVLEAVRSQLPSWLVSADGLAVHREAAAG